MNNIGKSLSKKLLSKTESLMLHSLGFVTGDPTIKIGYPYVFHPGLQITVSEPGNSKWIYMMLPLTKGSLITDIKIAQHRTGIQSHIELIRLVEQQEPISATVVHNEEISNTAPSTGVIGTGCHVLVNNSIMLKVCMDFANTDDMIELGSIEVRYIPNYKHIKNKKEKQEKRTINKNRLIGDLVNTDYSMNLHKPSFMEFFVMKKRKNKTIY